jgi:hypothetical protein
LNASIYATAISKFDQLSRHSHLALGSLASWKADRVAWRLLIAGVAQVPADLAVTVAFAILGLWHS